METTRLIVLRGPPGAGKSTTAKHLFSKAANPMVLIEQVYYRFIFKPAGGEKHSKSVQKIILHNVLMALDDGYDMILEGILNVRTYKDVFSAIFKTRPKDNYLFYFDVSLGETLKRHQTRQTANLSTEQDMRDWYKDKDLLGYDFEQVIPESSGEAQTLAMIRNRTAW